MFTQKKKNFSMTWDEFLSGLSVFALLCLILSGFSGLPGTVRNAVERPYV